VGDVSFAGGAPRGAARLYVVTAEC